MVVAFPFIDVKIDTSALTPVARRSAGVLAIVGVSAEGTAALGIPEAVTSDAEVATKFGAATLLGRSLSVALAQEPGPDTVYGVKVAADAKAVGLTALESFKDVTFVTLAQTFATVGGALGADFTALSQHCDDMSRQGLKRMGVVALNPAVAADGSADPVDAQIGLVDPALRSATGRLILVAARGAQDAAGTVVDIAAAAAAAIAGLPVATSVVLKRVSGFIIPKAQQYRPSEITTLARAAILPIIRPALIPGESLHFGDGMTFSSNPAVGYVDTVRLLDDLDFALKAALIGTIGDARITRSGLRFIVQRAGGVLDRYVLAGGVDSWQIDVPLLAILDTPEAQRSQAQTDVITSARAERLVEMTVIAVLGPQVHRISLTLKPTFA